MIKRFLDILFSSVLILLSSPLLFLIALLVRLDSAGPIIFRQKRIGQGGKPFTFYKFRTMIEDAESLGPVITAKNDARITQIGRLLRWLKLDELPQFFNVLKGDMSLVGPRPEVPKIVDLYTTEQRQVLAVKPGIIGTSQITNRNEEEKLIEGEGVEDFYVEKLLPEKIKTDLHYIRNKDPFKDLRILLGGTFTLIFSSMKLPYILESRRRILFLLFDLAISGFSFWFAYVLRFDGPPTGGDLQTVKTLLPLVFILRAPCFIYFGLYQTLWQYLGIQELFSIIKAVTAGSFLIPLIPFLFQSDFPPRTVLIVDWLFLIISLGGSRVIFKLTAERLRKPLLGKKKNVLIIGAEDTGEFLVREFIKNQAMGYRPAAFLDDDEQKLGIRIHGVKVMGKIAQLAQVVKVRKIDEVIIALSKASGDEIRQIIQICNELKLPCRIVPSTSSLLSPQILPLRLRPVDVSDLLGRELVQANISGIQSLLRGKRVLVTGAGGSIGSELCKIIFQNQPEELIMVDNGESSLYEIEQELASKPLAVPVVSYLASVTDSETMEKIFRRHQPQIVYHAAAYKHVPLMEIHYAQAIRNNVLGTKITADLAKKYGAESFVLISTDKAINPTSIMGATKRVCEVYAQSLRGGKTRFLAVRFGNVFNSKGSVVPLFRRQIELGGPVTVTDPEVTRYFMDVSEAVFLILQATLLGSDSEIFVLEMGKPVKIAELAKDLIRLMGIPLERMPIKYTGLRPGEKLEEELQLSSETASPTSHPKIKIWKPSKQSGQEVHSAIEELIRLTDGDVPARGVVVQALKKIVPEYNPWNPQL